MGTGTDSLDHKNLIYSLNASKKPLCRCILRPCARYRHKDLGRVSANTGLGNLSTTIALIRKDRLITVTEHITDAEKK